MLRGFRIFGSEYQESTWKGMLLKVVSIVSERYPDIVDSLYDAESFFWTSKKVEYMQYCTMIGPDKYLWTSMDNKGKLRCLRYLFDKCDVAESELVIILEPTKDFVDVNSES